MFKRLFKRNTNRLLPVNRLFVFLNEVIKARAKRTAQLLTLRTNKLSPKQIIYGLYCFSAVGVLVNVGLIVLAFQAGSVPTGKKNVTLKDKVVVRHFPSSTYSLADYQRICRIEAFFDSLQQTASGKRQYDSFMQQRPHFKDSIALCKQLYEQH